MFDGATMATKSKFVRELAALSPTGVEVSLMLETRANLMLTLFQSVPTVVATRYSTLHAREITKSERNFNTLKGPKGDNGNGVLRREGDEAEVDSVESNDEDWMTPDEMLRRGISKKRLDHKKKVAKFPPISCPKLRGKRLEVLTKDVNKIQPDDNLAQYKLTHKQLGVIR